MANDKGPGKRQPMLFQAKFPKQQDLENFLELYEHGKHLRKALSGILGDKLEKAIRETEDKGNYADPAYTHKIADLAGYRRGLREAISLLEVEVERPVT